ncbi:MAG: hypothetical protein ACM33T_02320 [Solirubrobacterales bacterium]
MTALHPLAPDFTIHLMEGGPEVSPAIMALVDSLWREAQASNPRLFDGQIFARSALSIGPSGLVRRLSGWFVPYRLYHACRRDPTVAEVVGLRAVGVSGRLRAPGGFIVGRRAATVMDAGRWELVPSGSIDSTAVHGGIVAADEILANELREEVGLGRDALTGPPAPLAYVEDVGTGVDDVAFELGTRLELPAIQRAHAQAGKEYELLGITTAADYLALPEDCSIATSRALLRGL